MDLKTYTEKHSQSALAKLLDLPSSFVNQMVTGKRPVPIPVCVAIERVSDGLVTRQELRPSDYWLIWPDLEMPASAQAEAGA